MRFGFVVRSTSVVALAALICGCGGSPVTPSASFAPAPAGDAVDGHHPRAWIRPGTSSGELLYAQGYSQTEGRDVTFILSYPQGQLVGSIDVDPAGMCADTQGNVYLLQSNSATEYAHGGTEPIRTVRVPGATTQACAVDPTTGNLAVTFYCPPCGYETLAIFPSGSSKSMRYNSLPFSTATYDDLGNLFLASYQGGIVELPDGSSQPIPISLNENIGELGQIQWDGTYVTLQNIKPPATISRISINGSTATVVSQSKFGPFMRSIGYSWIAGDGTVTFPFSTKGGGTPNLGIWKYPRGTHPMHTLKKIGIGDRGFGAIAVSVSPGGLRKRP